MISSKSDLYYYLEEDRKALGRKESRPRFFGDEIWKFQRALRTLEYFTNCKNAPFRRVILPLVKFRCHSLSIKCNFSIPINVFGPGLAIAHRGTIVINSQTKVGRDCRIHTCVNIGASGGVKDAVPTIGDRVLISPGVKIFGKIEIADDIVIGANAVVNKSFHESGMIIAGVPAQIIKKRDCQS